MLIVGKRKNLMVMIFIRVPVHILQYMIVKWMWNELGFNLINKHMNDWRNLKVLKNLG